MYSCLSGGLGNQMFQYAAAYILQQYFPAAKLVLDDGYYYFQPKKDTVRHLEINQFSIRYDRFSNEDEKKQIKSLRTLKKIPLPEAMLKCLASFFFHKYVLSDCSYYNPELIKNADGACLFSFYQDAELLNKNRELVLPLFELRDDLKVICKGLDVYRFIQDNQNVTSLHIRRGDYVTNQHAAKYHGVLDMSYYNKAMDYVTYERGEQFFVIFSDDVEWAKGEFSKRENCFVVDNNDYNFSAIDMYLMSLCKNNIIANSTYSWWGAWLNKFEDKLVIAPKQWFVGNTDTSLKSKGWITF